MGMMVAIAGMVVYSWAVEGDKQAAASKLTVFVNSEEESKPLRQPGFEGSEDDVEFGKSHQ